MRVVIKNPAPDGDIGTKWGDYHFGNSLVKALERRGVTASQEFWPKWADSDRADIVIVLRGRRRSLVTGGSLKLMWIISHPSTVSLEEIKTFDMTFVGSETHYNMIKSGANLPVEIARQCTDMRSMKRPAAHRRGIGFVANSRGVRREILRWAVDSMVPVQVIGRHWRSLGLQDHVVRDYIDNEKLPEYYSGLRLSLNDHWSDMKHYGYINNRVFDCIACGTPVLSDSFPEISRLFGDAVLLASDKSSFESMMTRYYVSYPDVSQGIVRLWENIGSQYTFDARAEQIINWAQAAPVSSRQVSSRSRSASLVSVVARQSLASLRARGNLGVVSILHLCPSREAMSDVCEISGISYLSAGIGDGPWNVAVDSSLTSFADKQFDVILLEHSVEMASLAPDVRDALEKCGERKLKSGGIMVRC